MWGKSLEKQGVLLLSPRTNSQGDIGCAIVIDDDGACELANFLRQRDLAGQCDGLLAGEAIRVRVGAGSFGTWEEGPLLHGLREGTGGFAVWERQA